MREPWKFERQALAQSDVWKPIKTEWSLQAGVVSALIRHIEEDQADIKSIARTIIDSALVHGGLDRVLTSLRYIFGQRYKSEAKDTVPPKFLDDLRKQGTWLESHNNIPPRSYFVRFPVTHDALKEKYGDQEREGDTKS